MYIMKEIGKSFVRYVYTAHMFVLLEFLGMQQVATVALNHLFRYVNHYMATVSFLCNTKDKMILGVLWHDAWLLWLRKSLSCECM